MEEYESDRCDTPPLERQVQTGLGSPSTNRGESIANPEQTAASASADAKTRVSDTNELQNGPLQNLLGDGPSLSESGSPMVAMAVPSAEPEEHCQNDAVAEADNTLSMSQDLDLDDDMPGAESDGGVQKCESPVEAVAASSSEAGSSDDDVPPAANSSQKLSTNSDDSDSDSDESVGRRRKRSTTHGANLADEVTPQAKHADDLEDDDMPAGDDSAEAEQVDANGEIDVSLVQPRPGEDIEEAILRVKRDHMKQATMTAEERKKAQERQAMLDAASQFGSTTKSLSRTEKQSLVSSVLSKLQARRAAFTKRVEQRNLARNAKPMAEKAMIWGEDVLPRSEPATSVAKLAATASNTTSAAVPASTAGFGFFKSSASRTNPGSCTSTSASASGAAVRGSNGSALAGIHKPLPNTAPLLEQLEKAVLQTGSVPNKIGKTVIDRKVIAKALHMSHMRMKSNSIAQSRGFKDARALGLFEARRKANATATADRRNDTQRAAARLRAMQEEQEQAAACQQMMSDEDMSDEEGGGSDANEPDGSDGNSRSESDQPGARKMKTYGRSKPAAPRDLEGDDSSDDGDDVDEASEKADASTSAEGVSTAPKLSSTAAGKKASSGASKPLTGLAKMFASQQARQAGKKLGESSEAAEEEADAEASSEEEGEESGSDGEAASGSGSDAESVEEPPKPKGPRNQMYRDMLRADAEAFKRRQKLMKMGAFEDEAEEDEDEEGGGAGLNDFGINGPQTKAKQMTLDGTTVEDAEEEAQLMEQLGAGSDLEGDLEAVVDQLSDDEDQGDITDLIAERQRDEDDEQVDRIMRGIEDRRRKDAVIRRLNASMDDQNQMLADGDEQALAARERARMFGQGDAIDADLLLSESSDEEPDTTEATQTATGYDSAEDERQKLKQAQRSARREKLIRQVGGSLALKPTGGLSSDLPEDDEETQMILTSINTPNSLTSFGRSNSVGTRSTLSTQRTPVAAATPSAPLSAKEATPKAVERSSTVPSTVSPPSFAAAGVSTDAGTTSSSGAAQSASSDKAGTVAAEASSPAQADTGRRRSRKQQNPSKHPLGSTTTRLPHGVQRSSTLTGAHRRVPLGMHAPSRQASMGFSTLSRQNSFVESSGLAINSQSSMPAADCAFGGSSNAGGMNAQMSSGKRFVFTSEASRSAAPAASSDAQGGQKRKFAAMGKPQGRAAKKVSRSSQKQLQRSTSLFAQVVRGGDAQLLKNAQR